MSENRPFSVVILQTRESWSKTAFLATDELILPRTPANLSPLPRQSLAFPTKYWAMVLSCSTRPSFPKNCEGFAHGDKHGKPQAASIGVHFSTSSSHVATFRTGRFSSHTFLSFNPWAPSIFVDVHVDGSVLPPLDHIRNGMGRRPLGRIWRPQPSECAHGGVVLRERLLLHRTRRHHGRRTIWKRFRSTTASVRTNWPDVRGRSSPRSAT